MKIRLWVVKFSRAVGRAGRQAHRQTRHTAFLHMYLLMSSAERAGNENDTKKKSEAPQQALLKMNLVSVTCATFLLLVVR